MSSVLDVAGQNSAVWSFKLWKQYSGIDLYEITLGFAFAIVSIYVVSLLGQGPSQSMATRFS